MNIANPQNMELQEWVDHVAFETEAETGKIIILTDDDWRFWAAQFTNVYSNVPNPYIFEDWEDWAERFKEVVA